MPVQTARLQTFLALFRSSRLGYQAVGAFDPALRCAGERWKAAARIKAQQTEYRPEHSQTGPSRCR